MAVEIIASNSNTLMLKISIPLETAMLEGEQSIQQVLNETGALASGELLKQFDTDGSAIQLGTTKLTSKGQVEKAYQTPYGETRIKGHGRNPGHPEPPVQIRTCATNAYGSYFEYLAQNRISG